MSTSSTDFTVVVVGSVVTWLLGLVRRELLMTVSALMVMGSLVVVIDSVVVVDAAVASVAVLKMLRLMGRVRREEELVLVPAALLALAFWLPKTLPIVRIICSARLPVTGRTRLLLLTGAVLTTGGVAVVVVDPPPLMEAETAAAKASAVTLGVDFEELDSGGGVLVMVTVVFSGVTIVKVNGLVRSTVESVTTTEAVAGTCVELTTKVSVVDGTSVVVSEGVTSDRMLTTGSANVVVVVGAAVVVERTLPEPNSLDPVSLTRPVPPSRLDSKLLTMVASEMVSGSSGPSVSSSSSPSRVVGAKVVVVVPASVVTDSTVVNGTVVPSVVKAKAMGENELRAKTDGLIGVLLRGGNRVVDVTGSVTTEKVVVGTDSAVVVSAASSATLGASVRISTVVGEIVVVVVVVGVVVLTRLRGKVGNKVDGFSVVVVVLVTSSEPRNLVNSLESSLSCTTTTVGLMLSVSTAFNSLTAAVLDPPSLILRRNCGWRMTAVSSKSPASVMLSLALGLVRMMVLT